MPKTSALGRFLRNALIAGALGVCLVGLAGAAWAWATTRTHVATFRLDVPAERLARGALEQATGVVAARLEALRSALELGRSSVRAVPPDRIELTLRSRTGPRDALAWLTMQGRAEFRLLHPEADLAPGADELPPDCEVKTWRQRRYVLARLGELKVVEHDYVVERKPVLVVQGFRNVRFETVGNKKAVILTFEFNEADAKAFATLTALHAGRTMAMLVDGEMFFPPKRIESAVTGGRVQVQGYFYIKPLRRLATVLACGSLPGPLVTVGPD